VHADGRVLRIDHELQDHLGLDGLRKTERRSRRRSIRGTARDLVGSDHLRVLATAYAARGALTGVVRQTT
jgi:hypothetical protein